MRPLRFTAGLMAAVLAGTAIWLIHRVSQSSDPREGNGAVSTLSLTGLLGDSDGGYRKALGPMPFRFPKDHGPHPDYHNEWWYFTGNLRDARGKEFGYQLTFFRSAISPPGKDSVRSSPWASNQAYMAHFAVTEAGGSFRAYERFSRAALGLAGARVSPFRVRLEDWTCESLEGDASVFPLHLRAAQGSIAIDLILEKGKPMVLQGDSGFSRKGPGEGNASYYYSYTRLPTKGRIATASGNFEVTGDSWMDREWGSSTLNAGTAGWEWFGLQLSDSTEFLFFRLRPIASSGEARGPVAFDYGMRVDPEGHGQALRKDDMRAEILSVWKSPRGGTYPARWRIEIPSLKLRMEIAPKSRDQELNLSIPYWEGAVGVAADLNGKPLGGEGYMELTGYR